MMRKINNRPAGVLGILCLIFSFMWMLDTDSPSFSAKLLEAGIIFALGVFFIWLRFKRLSDDLKKEPRTSNSN